MTNQIKAGEGFIPTTMDEFTARTTAQTNEDVFRDYAESKKAIENAKAAQKAMVEAVKASAEYQEFEAFVKTEGEALAETEDKVKAIVRQEWRATKNKKPFPGFGIQEKTVYSWDRDTAIEYAEKFIPLSVEIVKNFDEKMFTDQIKRLKVLPSFVSVREEVVVTISKDLSAWLTAPVTE